MSPRESTRIPMPATPGRQPEKRFAPLCPIWKNELRLRIIAASRKRAHPYPCHPGKPAGAGAEIRQGRSWLEQRIATSYPIWKNELRLCIRAAPRKRAHPMRRESARTPIPATPGSRPSRYLPFTQPPFYSVPFLSALPYCEGYGNCAYDSVTSQCLKFG